MAHVQVFNHHIQLPYLVLSIVECLLHFACAYVSVVLSVVGFEFHQFAPNALTFDYALIYTVVMMLATYAMGVYGAAVTEGFGSMFVRSIVSYCLLGAAALTLLPYLAVDFEVMTGSLYIAVCLSLLLVMCVRKVFYSLVDAASLKRRILVLGAGKRAKRIVDHVNAEALIGCDIVGFVPADSGNPMVDGDMLFDPIDGMKSLVDKHKVDEILIAIDEQRRDKGSFFPLQELLHCKLSGTRITEVVEFYEREFSRIELSEINTSWMLFRDGFRHSVSRDKAKRAFDIVISLFLLFLVWPFMLATALAVFLESGAPILYTQKRVGYRGQLFNIYKFRSMTKNAEKDGKAVWAKQNDARVTRVGAFIRNTRLDELPQIFNILNGEMSFIGPRPERPEFVADLSEKLPFYDVRHYVKPGLMGWAQLKYSYGASIEDAANKLVYDLYYVKKHSILLDVLVVIQSVEVVLLGKGVR